jgi:hypothetical protein
VTIGLSSSTGWIVSACGFEFFLAEDFGEDFGLWRGDGDLIGSTFVLHGHQRIKVFEVLHLFLLCLVSFLRTNINRFLHWLTFGTRISHPKFAMSLLLSETEAVKRSKTDESSNDFQFMPIFLLVPAVWMRKVRGLLLSLFSYSLLFSSASPLEDLSFPYHSSSDSCPFDNLQFHENSFHSQNGEDGILLKLLSIIGVTNKLYVEFGVENGQECNTRFLRENYGFHGLMMDGGNENQQIGLKQEFITVQNILELFEKYLVPKEFDILSVDLDLFDWWILAKILGATQNLNTNTSDMSASSSHERAYQPRMIVVEVNPTLGITSPQLRYQFHQRNQHPLTVTHPITTNQTTWDLTRYSGANPKAFQLLGQQFGYEMVYCESCGVNCFLIRRDLIPSSCLRRNSNDHLPLPHLSYPCFATESNNYQRGHPVDSNPLRMPLFVDSTLLSLATSDHLSSLTPSVASSFLEPNLFYSNNKRFSSIFSHSSSPLTSQILHSKIFSREHFDILPDLMLHSSSAEELESFLQLVNQASASYSQLHSSPSPSSSSSSSSFLALSFCEDLEQSLLHQLPLRLPNGQSTNFPHTTCEDISFKYTQLILHNLMTATVTVTQDATTDAASLSFLSTRNRTQQLLSQGLSYSPNNELLLTIQRYLSLANHLTCSYSAISSPTNVTPTPTAGCGEHHFAHDLLSVISFQGGQQHSISVGIGICDSLTQQSLRLAEIFDMSSAHRDQLTHHLLTVIQQQIYASSFTHSLISNEWIKNDQRHQLTSLSSVLTNIPLFLRVLFPPPYPHPSSSSPSLSSSSFSTLSSSAIISGSPICARRAQRDVLLIFDDSSPSSPSSTPSPSPTALINSQIISACGCDSNLISALLGSPLPPNPPSPFTPLPPQREKTFSHCLKNLPELSNGFFPRGTGDVSSSSLSPSSQLHQSLQQIYELSLLSSSPELYHSSLFAFTAPLWSAPLGATLSSSLSSSREVHVLLPLLHPVVAVCQLLQRYQFLPSSLLSISELLQFHQTLFRSQLMSLRYLSSSGKVFLYLPDLYEDLSTEEGRTGLQQAQDYLSTLLLTQPPSSLGNENDNDKEGAIPIPSVLRNFESMQRIQSFHCDVSLNLSASTSSAIAITPWILDCYRVLDAQTFPHKLSLLTEDTIRALIKCLPPFPPH